MTPWLDDGDMVLYLGDCIEVMAALDPESVDAVVCDSPYGLEFMGKDWDSFSPHALVTRTGWDRASSGASVTKSGFSKLGKNGTPAYGGGRSSYECCRCGRRDAFRNPSTCSDERGHDWRAINPNGTAALAAFAAWCETWAREALRVLKPGGHLLAFGGTRTFHRLTCGIEDAGFEIRDCLSWLYGSGFPKSLDVSKAIDKAAGAERADIYEDKPGVTDNLAYGAGLGVRLVERRPATDAAREWQGWGTALKPGFEPCVVARKPLAGTVADNVQQHGTGALNIDGCRIGRDADDVSRWSLTGSKASDNRAMSGGNTERAPKPDAAGRWPANVALDEQAAAMLDAQSGDLRPATSRTNRPDRSPFANGTEPTQASDVYADTGGASRFYYTAKASRADRNTSGANNTHPTVKPTDLMRWLVRLVTPPGGVVLDPFAGSGSTLVAARAEGVRAIGIEQDEEYAGIIRDRLAQLSLFSEGMQND